MAAKSKSFLDGSSAGSSWANGGADPKKLSNLMSWFSQLCESADWHPYDVYAATLKASFRSVLNTDPQSELSVTVRDALDWWVAAATAARVAWPTDDAEQSAFVEGFVRAAVSAEGG